MRIRVSVLCSVLIAFLVVTACDNGKKGSSEEGDQVALEGNDFLVTIRTDFGEMKAVLHDETPKHKENFLKLINDGFYDSLLFHRVISGFMIQGGDPDSKNATSEQRLGSGGPGYTVPAEFNDKFYHRKGALSAARQPTQVNPERASSGSQFYIVHGQIFPPAALEQPNMQLLSQALVDFRTSSPDHELNKLFMDAYNENGAQGYQNAVMENLDAFEEAVGQAFRVPEDRLEVYTTIGGYPPLDGDYTVFGQVISGFDVLDSIAAVPTRNPNREDRPIDEVRMFVSVEELPKTEIAEKYGYTYEK